MSVSSVSVDRGEILADNGLVEVSKANWDWTFKYSTYCDFPATTRSFRHKSPAFEGSGASGSTRSLTAILETPDFNCLPCDLVELEVKPCKINEVIKLHENPFVKTSPRNTALKVDSYKFPFFGKIFVTRKMMTSEFSCLARFGWKICGSIWESKFRSQKFLPKSCNCSELTAISYSWA
jgi:hypothetical protein